ncbi:MAG: GspH/FimT family pseudopilin [Candidatus Competibacteraceae bacterium]|nr:GspH/FimT family pseudopilin [Candidatus Competibacteraceae bacterium]MBK8755166.1 GspH/FimT family pseudopilin [Candidatus Competibacteraceae bacterium]
MNRQRGFTLIELIITVAIAAILLAIGVPSFQEMMRNNRVAAHTNDLLSSLNLARSEAIKRGVRVSLCKSSDGLSCATTGDWTQGWIVFVDTDNDATVDAGENILRVHGALTGGDTLVGSTDVSNYISYSPDGVAWPIAGTAPLAAGTTMSFSLCSASHVNAVEISQTGRSRMVKVACP